MRVLVEGQGLVRVLRGRGVLLALIFDEHLELLNSRLLEIDNLLRFSMDSVVSIKFFLQLDDCFVSFVEP